MPFVEREELTSTWTRCPDWSSTTTEASVDFSVPIILRRNDSFACPRLLRYDEGRLLASADVADELRSRRS